MTTTLGLRSAISSVWGAATVSWIPLSKIKNALSWMLRIWSTLNLRQMAGWGSPACCWLTQPSVVISPRWGSVRQHEISSTGNSTSNNPPTVAQVMAGDQCSSGLLRGAGKKSYEWSFESDSKFTIPAFLELLTITNYWCFALPRMVVRLVGWLVSWRGVPLAKWQVLAVSSNT